MEKKAIFHTIHPLIKELKKTVIEDNLSDAIVSACAIRKIATIEGRELDEMSMALTNDIQDYFKGFRLPEIVQAIQDGAKGLYEREGDMTTVSLELILKWIRRYAETVRKEALHKQKVHEEKEAEKDKEKERIAGNGLLKDRINAHYHDFCNGKTLKESVDNEFWISILSNLFVFLEKLNMIELSSDVFLNCGSRALKQIEGEKPNRQEHTAFKVWNQTKENQALNLARVYALENQFELWQMEGKEIVFNS